MTGTGCVIVYVILLLFVNSVHISSFFYSCRIRGWYQELLGGSYTSHS